MDANPDCLSCIHFSVSWDMRFPRSCRVFGIKSRDLPSAVVFRATGHRCPAYKRNPKVKARGKRDDEPGILV